MMAPMDYLVHVPGMWPGEQDARPACGELGVMQLEVYDIEEGKLSPGERKGRVRTENAFQPHVTCDDCGWAMVWSRVSVHPPSVVAIRWQAWLNGDRRGPAAADCTFMMRVS